MLAAPVELPSMESFLYELEKSFERTIRKLKSPTSASFDLACWQAALAGCPTAGTRERRLVDVAEWIGAQSALGRTLLSTQKLAALDSEWQTLLAIAALNREFRTGDELIRDKLKAANNKKGAILDDLSGMTIKSASGTPVGAADLAEASVDAIESWLFDALNTSGMPPSESDDVTTAVVEAIRAYTWRKALNVLWNQALYQGAYLATNGTDLRLLPEDPELERVLAACLARQELNLLNFPMIDHQVWIAMKPPARRKFGMLRSVTGVKRTGDKVSLKVGALPYLSKHLPAYVSEKGGLEGSYLVDFLDTPMPVDNHINARLLLSAWHVIRDAAEAMTATVPLPEKITPRSARDLALAIERSELFAAMTTALGVENEVADALLNFLTYAPKRGGAKGHRGLWSAPLVPVPGTDLMALPLPALITSNPLRKLEGWLEKGGIDDSNPIVARGDRYETIYRAQLCNAIQRNPMFKTAYCAEHAIKRNARFDEQIDLLFSFGGLALVGELKFFLTPADPHERSRYLSKLKDASVQAARKAKALDARRDIVAAALQIKLADAEALEVLPIVVTNQGFGISLEVEGVRIVDAYFLKTYLSGSGLVTSMAVSNRSPNSAQASQSYYSTEIGARRQFQAEIADPFVLRRFLDRVKFRLLSMPALKGPDLQVAAAYLAEMEGLERMNAEALMASMNAG